LLGAFLPAAINSAAHAVLVLNIDLRHRRFLFPKYLLANFFMDNNARAAVRSRTEREPAKESGGRAAGARAREESEREQSIFPLIYD
jgi:hypothetical protein